MSLRTKVLILFYGITLLLISLLTIWDFYRIGSAVRDILLKDTTDYVKAESLHIAEYLHQGDYYKIMETLKTNPLSEVKDLLVIEGEGYIIASKIQGLVLFERFPEFESLKSLRDTKIKHLEEENLFEIIQPIFFEEELLGFLIVYLDYSYYQDIVKDKVVLSIFSALLVIAVIFVVVRYADRQFSKRISTAIDMLDSIGKGNFNLPDPPRDGGELADLYRHIKLTSEHLKESLISKSFYEKVINSLVEGLIVLDPQGGILEINASFCRIVGSDCRDIRGKNLNDVFPELMRKLKKATKSGKNRERFSCSRTGEEKHYLLFISRHEDIIIVTLNEVTQMVEYERKLTEMSLTDHLTGLKNRRAVEDILSMEMEIARRYERPLCFALIDVDHFKKVNDTYGHDVGDEVLKKLARILKEDLRSPDVLGRWGGEEFALILPETDIKGAEVLCERLREAVEKTTFDKVNKITISIGLTQFKKEDTMNSLVKRADEALYEAKAKGRNRVEIKL